MTQAEALKILKTGANVFLTGEPGAGKTHTTNEYVAYLRARGVAVAVTASTGIAATHLGGFTIHSWSGIGIKTSLNKYELDRIASSEYVAKRVRAAKVLIIDEVSMLLPETLGMVEAVCREVKQSEELFGGLQIILVGDFFQLPPISKGERARFAYEAALWQAKPPIVCYLTEQHRQDDDDFLNILAAIRRNEFTEDHFVQLESRRIILADAPAHAPKLFSHNADVDRINDATLEEIDGPAEQFKMSAHGAPALVASLKKGCLSPELLILKVGAEVMFTKNNLKDGFVNGTLGTVVGFEAGSRYPIVKTRAGRKITLEPMEWVVEDNGKIKARLTQIPLRLAWAITVHKSQGMSLDEAVMDLAEVFEYGQGYVALSRVRRLAGLHLLGWNERAFQVHPQVLAKDANFRAQSDSAATAFAKMSPVKLQNLHDNFLCAAGGTLKPSVVVGNRNRAAKIPTQLTTLALWQAGKTIAEIADARKLTAQTIVAHIEMLVEKNKIKTEELSRLLTPALSAALPTIHRAFHELQTDNLSPIFEHFGGHYPYDYLRLARLFLERKNNHAP